MRRQSRFNEHFAQPLKRDRNVNASASDKRLANKRHAELKEIIDRHVLRRTKVNEVQDTRDVREVSLSSSIVIDVAVLDGIMSGSGGVHPLS